MNANQIAHAIAQRCNEQRISTADNEVVYVPNEVIDLAYLQLAMSDTAGPPRQVSGGPLLAALKRPASSLLTYEYLPCADEDCEGHDLALRLLEGPNTAVVFGVGGGGASTIASFQPAATPSVAQAFVTDWIRDDGYYSLALPQALPKAIINHRPDLLPPEYMRATMEAWLDRGRLRPGWGTTEDLRCAVGELAYEARLCPCCAAKKGGTEFGDRLDTLGRNRELRCIPSDREPLLQLYWHFAYVEQTTRAVKPPTLH